MIWDSSRLSATCGPSRLLTEAIDQSYTSALSLDDADGPQANWILGQMTPYASSCPSRFGTWSAPDSSASWSICPSRSTTCKGSTRRPSRDTRRCLASVHARDRADAPVPAGAHSKQGLLRFSLWALNLGLMAMCLGSLLPMGLMQPRRRSSTGTGMPGAPSLYRRQSCRTSAGCACREIRCFFLRAVSLVIFAGRLATGRPFGPVPNERAN